MMSRTKVAIILLLNLILLGLALAWYYHTPPLSVSCEGSLSFIDRRDDHAYRFEGEVIMRFHPDNTGYLTFNGNVMSMSHRWDVSRLGMFKWRRLQGALYEIVIQKVERFSQDVIPPDAFEKYVSGLTVGKKRLLTMERTPEEALVISSFYAPVLVCSE